MPFPFPLHRTVFPPLGSFSSFENLLRIPLRWSIVCIIPFHGTTAPYYHSATVSQYHEHCVHRTYIIMGILYLCDSRECILHQVHRACLFLLCFHLALWGYMSAPFPSRNSVSICWRNEEMILVFLTWITQLYSILNFNLLTWKSCQMTSILFTPMELSRG